MNKLDVVIFIMAGMALFLMVGFIRQYRLGTKSRKEAAQDALRYKAKTGRQHERAAEFDRIVFDVISKRKAMSTEERAYLLESIPYLYSSAAEIEEATAYVTGLYQTYGQKHG